MSFKVLQDLVLVLCHRMHNYPSVHHCPSSSTLHFNLCRHWLTSAYTQFAVPYFIYDIYAMFMCHWHRYRVKGHEVASGAQSLRTVTRTYLHKEFLMVVHHLFMVLVCFPVSVVSGDFGAGGTWTGGGISTHGVE